jgi:hypothetical protein
LLERFTPLYGKNLLEIGSGFDTNLGTWIKKYALDWYGTERDTEGFGSFFNVSREIFAANGLNPDRFIRVTDDTLPFRSASFDIVYSANVFEQTDWACFVVCAQAHYSIYLIARANSIREHIDAFMQLALVMRSSVY